MRNSQKIIKNSIFETGSKNNPDPRTIINDEWWPIHSKISDNQTPQNVDLFEDFLESVPLAAALPEGLFVMPAMERLTR